MRSAQDSVWPADSIMAVSCHAVSACGPFPFAVRVVGSPCLSRAHHSRAAASSHRDYSPNGNVPVLVPLGKVARWGEEEGMESPREQSWPGNESDFTSKSRDEKKEITNGIFNILCVLE